MCGWANASDAVEVLCVSFLLPTARCDLHLSSSDMGLLNASIFLGDSTLFVALLGRLSGFNLIISKCLYLPSLLWSHFASMYCANILDALTIVTIFPLLFDQNQGMMVGGYVWGYLADRRGRRNILVVSLAINGVFGSLASLAPVFWLFLLLRFISGIG